MALDVCPPPGARLPAGALWSSLLLLAASALMVGATRCVSPARQRLLRWAVALAMACAAGGIALDVVSHLQTGLSPRANAWSASVGALIAWQCFHALVLLIMGGYVLARSFTGRLLPDARATLDNSALMWHGAVGQALVGMALVRMLPAWMGV